MLRQLRAAALAAAFLLGAAGAGLAAEPGFYRVVGVAANDVLNVRSEPDAGADIVETLAPDAVPVEVLEVTETARGEWGRVVAADGNGWLAMRFLEPQEPLGFGGTDVPEGLQCMGNEPFWGVGLLDGQMVFSATDIDELALPLEAGMSAVGRNHRFAFIARDGNRRITAMIGRHESCTDGMSDRDYGWRIDLLTEGIGESPAASYEGCCMMPLPR